MESVKIDNVLKSFPEFSAAHKALREKVREQVNFACDSLEYTTAGEELYNNQEELIAVPLNDLYLLVAVENGAELGYKIVSKEYGDV